MDLNAVKELFNQFDSVTYNHSVRVALIAAEYETYSGIHCAKVTRGCDLSAAAMLHDLGKAYISASILDKVDPLSDLERKIVDLHPYIGYMALRDCGIAENICRIVLYHHGINPPSLSMVCECDDFDIINKAHMLHTIDVFEALTSDRPYHRGISAEEALGVMRCDTSYHPDVIKYIESAAKRESSETPVHRGYKYSSSDIVNCFFDDDEPFRVKLLC